jgi:hypothetical protein
MASTKSGNLLQTAKENTGKLKEPIKQFRSLKTETVLQIKGIEGKIAEFVNQYGNLFNKINAALAKANAEKDLAQRITTISTADIPNDKKVNELKKIESELNKIEVKSLLDGLEQNANLQKNEYAFLRKVVEGITLDAFKSFTHPPTQQTNTHTLEIPKKTTANTEVDIEKINNFERITTYLTNTLNNDKVEETKLQNFLEQVYEALLNETLRNTKTNCQKQIAEFSSQKTKSSTSSDTKTEEKEKIEPLIKALEESIEKYVTENIQSTDKATSLTKFQNDVLKLLKETWDTIEPWATDVKDQRAAFASINNLNHLINGFDLAGDTIKSETIDVLFKTVIAKSKDILDAIKTSVSGLLTSSDDAKKLKENLFNLETQLDLAAKSLTTALNLIENDLNHLFSYYTKRSNPTFVAATAVTSANVVPKLLNEYLNVKNNMPAQELQAREKFVRGLEAAHMVPRETLKLTNMDKIVFVFLTLFIRLFALMILEQFIDKGHIKTMRIATIAFLCTYTGIFAIFVLLVNFDTYRLRIVFNYVNFHMHRGYVFAHLGVLWLFGIMIYMIMAAINFPIAGVKDIVISDEQKLDLIDRISMLSFILWIILVMLVILS